LLAVPVPRSDGSTFGSTGLASGCRVESPVPGAIARSFLGGGSTAHYLMGGDFPLSLSRRGCYSCSTLSPPSPPCSSDAAVPSASADGPVASESEKSADAVSSSSGSAGSSALRTGTRLSPQFFDPITAIRVGSQVEGWIMRADMGQVCVLGAKRCSSNMLQIAARRRVATRHFIT